MFPDVKNLQFIVIGYVADDWITLINLFHLWKIWQNPYKKIDFWFSDFVNSNPVIKPKTMKNIYGLLGNPDAARRIIEKIGNLENLEIDGDVCHTFDKNIFDGINIKTLKILRMYKLSGNIFTSLNIESLYLEFCALTEEDELKINQSVKNLEVKIIGDRKIMPKISLSEKSELLTFSVNFLNNNINQILNSGALKKVRGLSLKMDDIADLKIRSFSIFPELVSLHLSIENCDFMVLLNLINGTNLTELKIKSKKSGIHILDTDFKFDSVKILDIEPVINPDKLFYIFKNLTSLTFKSISNPCKLPLGLNELTIKINSVNTNGKLIIPDLVYKMKINIEYPFNAENMIFSISSNLQILIIDFNLYFIKDLEKFKNMLKKPKKLETIVLDSVKNENLQELIDTIPKNIVNLTISVSSIDHGIRLIDFRKFTKLRYLNLQIYNLDNYVNPPIFLPNTKHILYINTTKERYKFKNFRGLYIPLKN